MRIGIDATNLRSGSGAFTTATVPGDQLTPYNVILFAGLLATVRNAVPRAADPRVVGPRRVCVTLRRDSADDDHTAPPSPAMSLGRRSHVRVH